MLAEAVTAAAAAGGIAVVEGAASAAGTQAWESFRTRVAGWFGRGSGNAELERVTLERLDRTAAELDGADEAGQTRQADRWEDRFADVLEAAPEELRAELAQQLKTFSDELRAELNSGGGTTITSSGAGSLIATDKVDVKGSGSGSTAAVINNTNHYYGTTGSAPAPVNPPAPEPGQA
ncbi:hypothetical protein ACFXKS_10525 [Streptomyces scopuliridis]|uniref:hypothetical protein n=1 Tax=Streptomyces scopuliridis TaxID=452529 RepID=UPI0036BCCEDE